MKPLKDHLNWFKPVFPANKGKKQCPISFCRPDYDRSSIGGQEQIRFRSPCGLSTRPTEGQNFLDRNQGRGYAAISREYGCDHSFPVMTFSEWGALIRGLSSRSKSPFSILRISSRIEISASQKRSSSSRLSLSVGSIIRVPGTGQLIVGAWNP